MRTGLAIASILISSACSKDHAKPSPPPAPPLPTPTPAPVIVDAAPTAPAPAPIAVAMPGPDDIKAALALRCAHRKAGFGCTDAAGAEVIPFVHDEAIVFKASGLALVQTDGAGWAYVDAHGRAVLAPFYFDNGPDPLAEGRARVVAGGKIGFVDEEWRLVIPPQYDAAFGFAGGSARVCVGCDPRIWSEEAPPEAAKQPGREFWIDHAGTEVPRPPTP